jgi:8-oxo-dGTP diphosphatase
MVNEAKQIRLGSAVLITNADRVLLGRRNKEPNFGRWVLPGGKIEPGETHQQAAIREAFEELGIHITVGALVGKGVYHLLDDSYHRVIIYSLATTTDTHIKPSSDISEAKFFDRSELRCVDITPIVAEVLRDAGWL